jgi:hypothetical protein
MSDQVTGIRLSAVALLVALGGVCVAPPALAGKKECAAAYVEAQKLKQDGSFTKAREQLIVCAKDECMAAVKKDCVAWLDEVNAALPSVVVEAKGPDGKETFDVKVSIDGEVVSEKLDVKAIELDPGTHKFVFEYEGEEPIEQEVILRQGQKNKTLQVSFAPEKSESSTNEPEPEPEPIIDTGAAKNKPPTLAYVLGGVGVVALGGAGYFWLSGESKKKDLDSSGCEPNCDQGKVDSIKQQRLIGDIALGVGLACIGTAAYLWMKPGKKAPPAETSLVDVQLGRHGAWAGMSGRF